MKPYPALITVMITLSLFSALATASTSEADEEDAAQAKKEAQWKATNDEMEARVKEELRLRAKAVKDRQAASEKAEAEFRNAAKTGTAGPWRYTIDEDKMGSGAVKLVTTRSTNVFEFNFPYGGKQRATLALRAHPRRGRDVMLSIEKGQLLCALDDCSVLVRFGDGKPQRFTASGASDRSSEVLFIGDHDTFAANLKKVRTLRIEAQVYQAGGQVFEFDVAGLAWPFSGAK